MHFTKCHACKTASVSSPTSGVQFMLSSMSDTPIETTAFFFFCLSFTFYLLSSATVSYLCLLICISMIVFYIFKSIYSCNLYLAFYLISASGGNM